MKIYTNMQSLCLQFRGSEIVQLQNFRTATAEDIASVHTKSYIFGLEKVIQIFFFLTWTKERNERICNFKTKNDGGYCIGYGAGFRTGDYTHWWLWAHICHFHSKNFIVKMLCMCIDDVINLLFHRNSSGHCWI